MVPPYSHRVSRVRRYSGYCWLCSSFVYRTLTFYGVLSHTLRLDLQIPSAVRTPEKLLPPVWPLPRSLATTYGISVDFSSSPYLDVSVQAVPLLTLCIYVKMIHLQCIGLLHSDICGSFRACRSPQLFAAYRVLLRLPMPRHSPCALFSLTFAYGISSVGRNYAFFSWNLFFDCSIFYHAF